MAALFLLIYSAVYALCIGGEIHGLMPNAAKPDIDLIIDATVGTTLLNTTIRFLYHVIRINWSVS